MPADRFNPSTRADTSCFSSYRNLPFFDRIYAIHHARGFEWLRSKIAGLGKKALSVIELGCHDARSVEYISVPIRRYLGLDAGWRSGWKNGKACGLEAAQVRFRDRPHFEFRRSEHCEDLERVPGKFDAAIVLETLEYLEPSRLEAYVLTLSEKLIVKAPTPANAPRHMVQTSDQGVTELRWSVTAARNSREPGTQCLHE